MSKKTKAKQAEKTVLAKGRVSKTAKFPQIVKLLAENKTYEEIRTIVRCSKSTVAAAKREAEATAKSSKKSMDKKSPKGSKKS